MHNAALITEHTGADLFKMLLYECDRAAPGILIHGIKNSKRQCLKSTTFVPVAGTALLKKEGKNIKFLNFGEDLKRKGLKN